MAKRALVLLFQMYLKPILKIDIIGEGNVKKTPDKEVYE